MVMKEIDFLPEWYKSGRRRRVSLRTQYIALGGIFVMMLLWNFIATYSVRKAAAELAQTEPRQMEAESASQVFNKIKNEIAGLQKKAESIEKIVPKSSIKVANVLAEISFLIGKRMVLSKVEFVAEKFNSSSMETEVYRGIRKAQGDIRSAMLLGDVRFKVVINGIAANASEVAELICRLEDSPYFCLVSPSFSRNTEIKAETIGMKQDTGYEMRDTGYQASEFEIVCYLANYKELAIDN